MTTGVETTSSQLEVAFAEYLDPPASPISLLKAKVERAIHLGVNSPLAMAFATVGSSRKPSIRTIMVSEITNTGVIFATQSTSRKCREIKENAAATGLLYWRETNEQIAICGAVRKLSDAKAQQMWDVRPPWTHAMTVASHQSDPLDDVSRLRSIAVGLEKIAPLDRPKRYVACELVIDEIEFWAEGKNRLHERLIYRKSGDNWPYFRLQP